MSGLFLIVTCEHGGNVVPEPYAELFHDQDDILASHRGWDPGALPVATKLATGLRAPLFFSTITRLLIDSNRSSCHKTLFSEFSRPLPPKERQIVAQRHYTPHRELISTVIYAAIGQGKTVIHLAIHSFTPVLDGVTRKTGIGLLYDSTRPKEQALCRRWQKALATARPDLTIHRNAPYRGASDGLATWLRKNLCEDDYLGIEVEINQRFIASLPEQTAVADLLRQNLSSCLGVPAPTISDAPGDEIVTIVDEDNRPCGQVSRREMRRHRLIHRASYILVFNRQGELFVQTRTMSKDIYPGYFDIAAGGVVLADESYEESARRELKEELGVSGELEHLFDHYYADSGNKVWGRVFRCRHDGPFSLQASEVERGEFMNVGDILSSGLKVTPDGLEIIAKLNH